MKIVDPIIKVLEQHVNARILTTQDRESWKGVIIQQYKFVSDFWFQRPAHDYYVVCYLPASRSRLIQRRDGKVHEGRFFAGMSIIVPTQCEATYEGEPISATCMHVPYDLVSRAANEIGISYDIMNVFQTSDTTIETLANLFTSELHRPVHPAQALISDSLSGALATHLLRNYNARDMQEYVSSGFCPHALSRILAYIEDNSDTTIRLDELANVAGVSRFHFSRLFKVSTGKSPMAYVTESRIRKAQELILSGTLTLAQIAIMVGFADQSHFTRRFQLYTGCSPGVFARNKGIRLLNSLPEK